jgi:hypothetical protein
VRDLEQHLRGHPRVVDQRAVSYPVGHSVQEDIFYNTGNGDLTFTVNDLTAGTTSGFTLNIGTGVSGYFTTSPLIMTGPGNVTEANAGALNSTADGFSTFLVP